LRLLRGDHVRHNFRQRTIVTDRPGEHKVDLMLHTLKHNALAQNILRHRSRETAGGADSVDRAHVVIVAAIVRPQSKRAGGRRFMPHHATNGW
jgi:hypothetical protein